MAYPTLSQRVLASGLDDGEAASEAEFEPRKTLNQGSAKLTGPQGAETPEPGEEQAEVPSGAPVRTRGEIDGSRPAELVGEFHSVYGMPDRIRDGLPSSLDTNRLGMRMGLIAEETSELFAAVYGPLAGTAIAKAAANPPDQEERDIVETADALADLVYVVYGMALEIGVDLDAVLSEVHSSNLSKLMPDGSVRRRDDGKILKGPDFREPDIGSVISGRDKRLSSH